MLAALATLALLLPALPSPAAAGIPPKPASEGVLARIATRALLVRLVEGTSGADAAALWARAGVTPRGSASRLGVYTVLASTPAGRVSAERALAADPLVDRVERDRLVRASEDRGASAAVPPDDPRYPSEWWLEQVNVTPAWAYVGLRDPVAVAVLDTGVAFTHPDLAPVLEAGYNLVSPEVPPADDSSDGHGTHVAGILAAATDNGAGMAGVAWGSRILPVKVLDASGSGDDGTIAEGVVWATDNGVRVINMSLGGSAPCTETLVEAIDYAVARGVVVVAAAGNTSSAVQCPANLPNVVAVGNVEQSGVRRHSSNMGPELDIVAPGTDILSTVPLTVDPSGYATLTGTSMAAPIVSGALALVRSAAPSLTPARAVSVVQSATQDLGPSGRDDEYGWGRVDAGAAILASAELTAGSASAEPAMIFADGSGVADASTFTLTAAAEATARITVERVGGSASAAADDAVRELFHGSLGAGEAGSWTWDGLDASGARAADGAYEFVASLEGPAGRVQRVEVPISVTSSLTTASMSPAAFSPNGDRRADTTTAKATLRSPAKLTIEILDRSTGRVLRTLLSGNRGPGTWGAAWDGKIGSRVAAHGTYAIRFSATTASGTFTLTKTVSLDLNGVVATNLASGTVYNVRDGYRDTVNLRFRLANRASATARIYRVGSTTPARTIRAGMLSAGSNAIAWNGCDDAGRRLAAGTYRFRIETRTPGGITRLSGYGKVIVSSKRLVSRTYEVTVPGVEYLAQSYVSDPALGSIQPSPVTEDGVRIVIDGSGSPPATAIVFYAVSLPAAAVPVSLDVSVMYRRTGPSVPAAGLYLGSLGFVPVLQLEPLEGPRSVSVPLAGYASYLTGSAPTFVVAVRLQGSGTLDLGSFSVTYAYKVLQ